MTNRASPVRFSPAEDQQSSTLIVIKFNRVRLTTGHSTCADEKSDFIWAVNGDGGAAGELGVSLHPLRVIWSRRTVAMCFCSAVQKCGFSERISSFVPQALLPSPPVPSHPSPPWPGQPKQNKDPPPIVCDSAIHHKPSGKSAVRTYMSP